MQVNEAIQEIATLLASLQRPQSSESHHQALISLEKCRTAPEFDEYLAFIFVRGQGLAVEVRQTAGLLLKNDFVRSGRNVTTTRGASKVVSSTTRGLLLEGLGLEEKALRKTAGTCVATLVASRRLESWPELFDALAAALESPHSHPVQGALDTVYKLYEEAPMALEGSQGPRYSYQYHVLGAQQEQNQEQNRPSSALIPRMLVHFSNPDPESRALAVLATNLAAGYLPPSLVANMDRYVSGLFNLASDPAQPVRVAVCNGLVQLLRVAPEVIESQVGPIMEYMLASTQDADPSVALEACEFWSAFPESGLDVAPLRTILPRLLPVLLKSMVYDDFDDDVVEAEAEQENVNVGTEGNVDDAQVGRSHLASGRRGQGMWSEQGDDGDDEGEGDEGEGDGRQWNLRRCSAAALDMLSATFGDELLPLLLPEVQAKLGDGDWNVREAAILALGAVSEGCSTGLTPHVPAILTAVVPWVRDPRPMVRAIACWTLMRYMMRYIHIQPRDESLTVAVLNGVCERIVDDRVSKVQEASCGALATFVEDLGGRKVVKAENYNEYDGMIKTIVTTLATALTSNNYTRRSIRAVYDCVAAVADFLPDALRHVGPAAFLTPLISTRLASIHDDSDRELLPLLECISSAALASGRGLEPFGPALFTRCAGIADKMIAGIQSGAIHEADGSEFIVAALDALSGAVESLGAGAEPLVSGTAVRESLVMALDPKNKPMSADVRQSGFALVGDLATAVPGTLIAASLLSSLMESTLQALEPAAITHASMNACNNAAWAQGLLVTAVATCNDVGAMETVGRWAGEAADRLACLLEAPAGALPRSLVQNAAITLGRWAVVYAAPMAARIGRVGVIGGWCRALRGINDGGEKVAAFLGLCAILRQVPEAGAGAFTSLCEACVSWKDEASCGRAQGEIASILSGYKARLVELRQWEAAMASLGEPAARKLIHLYHL